MKCWIIWRQGNVVEGDGTTGQFYFADSGNKAGRGYSGVEDGFLYYMGKLQKADSGTKYEVIEVNDKNYLLVHGGLGNYSPEKDIDDYSLHELIWSRADYNIQYFSDKYVITGHTPTQAIRNNPNPGYIYRQNNHIAIDCGATYPGGRLAAICLDTGEEYYSEPNKMGSDAIGL